MGVLHVDVIRTDRGAFHDVLYDPFLGRTAPRGRSKAHQPRLSIEERPDLFRHEDRLGAAPTEPADQVPVRADDRLESGPPGGGPFDADDRGKDERLIPSPKVLRDLEDVDPHRPSRRMTVTSIVFRHRNEAFDRSAGPSDFLRASDLLRGVKVDEDARIVHRHFEDAPRVMAEDGAASLISRDRLYVVGEGPIEEDRIASSTSVGRDQDLRL